MRGGDGECGGGRDKGVKRELAVPDEAQIRILRERLGGRIDKGAKREMKAKKEK